MPFSSLARWVRPFLLVSLGTASACTVVAPADDNAEKAGVRSETSLAERRLLVSMPGPSTGFWVRNTSQTPLIAFSAHSVGYDPHTWCRDHGVVYSAVSSEPFRCRLIVAESTLAFGEHQMNQPSIQQSDMVIAELERGAYARDSSLRLATGLTQSRVEVRALGFPVDRGSRATVTSRCYQDGFDPSTDYADDFPIQWTKRADAQNNRLRIDGRTISVHFNRKLIRYASDCQPNKVQEKRFGLHGRLVLKPDETDGCAGQTTLLLREGNVFVIDHATSQLNHDCTMAAGNSGGPLIGAKGSVLGDVALGMTNTHWEKSGSYYMDPFPSFVKRHKKALDAYGVQYFDASTVR